MIRQSRKREAEEAVLAYKEDPTVEKRNAVWVMWLPMLRYIADKLFASLEAHVEREDLVSAGYNGFLRALERYDPQRGFKFITFAVPRIRGAMLDYVRTLDWVPRLTRLRISAIDRIKSDFLSEFDRSISNEELVSAIELKFGISKEYARRIIPQCIPKTQISLEEITQVDIDISAGFFDLKDNQAEQPHESCDIVEFLNRKMRGLTDNERYVVECYALGIPLHQIGKDLGVSESRCCQLLNMAREYLKRELERAGVNYDEGKNNRTCNR